MLRLKDAAQRLALSTSRLYEMVARGEIGHHRIGGAIRISEDQLAEYLEVTRQQMKRARDEPKPRQRKPPRPRPQKQWF
jgi:excisionase family DNA binding protein